MHNFAYISVDSSEHMIKPGAKIFLFTHKMKKKVQR